MSTRTASRFSDQSAYSRGIHPLSSRAQRDAPASATSVSIAPASPALAAWCSGVAPPTSAARTAPGSAASNSRKLAAAPVRAAWCGADSLAEDSFTATQLAAAP